MKKQLTAYSLQRIERLKSRAPIFLLEATSYKLQADARGFTLIETLVAITLLTVAIVAPMTLTTRSLSTAFYARDRVTAFHLAQEAVESVRNVRDGNVLSYALNENADLPDGILTGIPIGVPFIVDTLDGSMDAESCAGGGCPPLKTNGEFYGYEPGWETSRFTRTVRAVFVGENQDEVRITVDMSWQTGSFNAQTFTISENLYRWLDDGVAAE